MFVEKESFSCLATQKTRRKGKNKTKTIPLSENQKEIKSFSFHFDIITFLRLRTNAIKFAIFVVVAIYCPNFFDIFSI